MKFYSTNDRTISVGFKDALFKGISDDEGLFMPDEIPKFNGRLLNNLSSLSFQEICFEISNKFLSADIPNNELFSIVEKAINFDAPLIPLKENLNILELFHGPTFAFKDFGARFMGETFQHYLKDFNKEIIILVATSGDTGSAVANAFYKKDGIKVVLLYPGNKISNLQEKQLTTLGENVFALEINGTFDNCQLLVKTAFKDKDIKSRKILSSANSINIARLLPQTFYYFRSFQQIENKNAQLIISVPSGNLGNLTAGLIAQKMGLPVTKFIAATNSNSVFTKFLSTGNFKPEKSVLTLSNAMDVGNPSNFYRIKDLFDDNFEIIKELIESKSVSDRETIEAINQVYNNYNYILDPHGAVSFRAAQELFNGKRADKNIVILETAHPAKFSETVKKSIGIDIQLPDGLKSCLQKEKQSIKMSSDFAEFKEYLLSI